MLKKHAYLFFAILTINCNYAQNNNPAGFKLWKLTSIQGNIGVRGFYRVQERTLNNVLDESQYPFLSGAIMLYTTSYVGHPQLLRLDIGGEYNPGLSKQTFTVSPDRSEALTFKRLDIRATLFYGKPMSFSGFINRSQVIINREYISSQNTDTKEWGLTYDFRNKIIPISANFSDREWKQLEIETGRTFLNKQSDFKISTIKHFTKFGDRNELRFTRFEFRRLDNNKFLTYNLFNRIYLNSLLYFDKNRIFTLRSNVQNIKQQGNLNQKRIQVFENLQIKLPYRFVLSGNYDYTNVLQFTQRYTQHRVGTVLEHKLFSSLESKLFYNTFITNHTAYKEKNIRTGFSFKYRKKIPTGYLSLYYNYRLHYQNVLSNPNSIIYITNESHTLTDGQIELLEMQFAIVSTIVVKDVTGSIIYQENFDYIIINRGNGFYEIQRLPGGQIPNNGLVLVDYQATQVGSYKFDSENWSFSARINIFNRLLELYYTHNNQDYNNIQSEGILTLNYFKQNIFGGRILLGPFTGGVEWDIYNSTIVPYEKTRYFINVNGTLGNKLLLSLNGDVTNLTLTETKEYQFYSSLFGRAVYMIKPQSRLNFDMGYRKQLGQGIDLDFVTAKLEYNMIYRKLLFRLGLEIYRRLYVGEQINFNGVYFQIDRRF